MHGHSPRFKSNNWGKKWNPLSLGIVFGVKAWTSLVALASLWFVIRQPFLLTVAWFCCTTFGKDLKFWTWIPSLNFWQNMRLSLTDLLPFLWLHQSPCLLGLIKPMHLIVIQLRTLWSCIRILHLRFAVDCILAINGWFRNRIWRSTAGLHLNLLLSNQLIGILFKRLTVYFSVNNAMIVNWPFCAMHLCIENAAIHHISVMLFALSTTPTPQITEGTNISWRLYSYAKLPLPGLQAWKFLESLFLDHWVFLQHWILELIHLTNFKCSPPALAHKIPDGAWTAEI